eukprot:2775756-Pleurochrysis_carterae.AAC.1
MDESQHRYEGHRSATGEISHDSYGYTNVRANHMGYFLLCTYIFKMYTIDYDTALARRNADEKELKQLIGDTYTGLDTGED